MVAAELWPLYKSVFSDFDDLDTWRDQVSDSHVARPGFRIALHGAGGRLVGFGYGYTGDHGQCGD